MDRKTWIAVALSVIGLIVYYWWYSVTYAPYFEHQKRLAARKAAEARAASPTPAPSATPAAPAEPVERVVLQTGVLTSEGAGNVRTDFLFSNDAGGIESVVLRNHFAEKQQVVALNADPRLPIGAIGNAPGEIIGGFSMSIDNAAEQVLFKKDAGDSIVIEKRFSLPPDGDRNAPYVAFLDITFKNTGPREVSRPAYFVACGGAAPIHVSDMPVYTRFDWYRKGSMSNVDVNWFAASTLPLIGIQTRGAREFYVESKDQTAWASVGSQYFCTIVTSDAMEGSSVWARRFAVPEDNGARVYGIQGALGMAAFTLPPGGSQTHRFVIYAGPKELARLERLGGGQEAAMNFGMFGFVSKFLLWAMNGLRSVLGNYAAAIIVLTLCIKLALWPLQNQATNSMKKMSALSPKMTELREKYKDDPQKMNEELMKLYREYGVNPFGGCLPMLIQIPIFFGFYSMLGVAIELRNSSFLWVHDLSQPDTVFHAFGFPINVLPLVMAATMVWQMALTPKSGDATQQRIMMFMPVIFIVFAYNYASALSLYWTTQNLFSIFQLYLTRNKPLPELTKVSVAKKQAMPDAKKRRKQRRALP